MAPVPARPCPSSSVKAGGTTPRRVRRGKALPQSRVRQGRRNIPAARITEDNRGRVCGRGRAGRGEDRGCLCAARAGGLEGAACAFPAPARRQLAPTQQLCVNRAAVALGRAGDAAPVPEGCSGWPRVRAGLGLLLEPGLGLRPGVVLCSSSYTARHGRAGGVFGLPWSLWCMVR